MANEDATKIWTNGYIVLGTSTRIPVQEVSIDLSRDLKEHYNSGVSKPSALVPGQEMILFNNSSNPGDNTQGESVCSLTGCILDKNSISLGGSGDPVQEDVSGKALDITFNLTEIASMVNAACNNL